MRDSRKRTADGVLLAGAVSEISKDELDEDVTSGQEGGEPTPEEDAGDEPWKTPGLKSRRMTRLKRRIRCGRQRRTETEYDPCGNTAECEDPAICDPRMRVW